MIQRVPVFRKVLWPGVLGLVAVLGIGTHHLLRGQETADAYSFGRGAQIGRRITPVPVNLRGKDPDVVALGSYIVNAQASCNQCHTCPSFRGTNPYKTVPARTASVVNAANYLAGGTPFENGAIVSSNLTPDSSGMPGGLSFNDFKNVMTSGVSPHKTGHILQVMPWPDYRNMSNNDLHAIYVYLSALPAASAGSCTGPSQTN